MVATRSRHARDALVFENVVDQLGEANDGLILIAAAGNHSRHELAFPARFNNVLAIESIDRSGTLSKVTSRSTLDHLNGAHPNVLALPGGQTSRGDRPTEYIGVSAEGKRYWGGSPIKPNKAQRLREGARM